MIKRLTWFVSGAVAGVAGVGIAKRKVRQAATHLTPKNIVHGVRSHVRDAVAEGRVAMRAKEAELRATADGRVLRLADDLEEGDEVLVDGVPVEPGQVIVLKQIRDRDEDRRRFRA
jgi:hypothetical protein